jgi:hypothetical protein
MRRGKRGDLRQKGGQKSEADPGRGGKEGNVARKRI